MKSFNDIKVPGSELEYTRHDYVSMMRADYSEVNAFRGRFSICELQDTLFVKANLKEATLLCSILSDKTDLTDTDVDGTLWLGASLDGSSKPISRAWLFAKGARNAEKAITSLEDLKEKLANKSINLAMAEFYCKRINKIFHLLNSMQIRSQNENFDSKYARLLKQATKENLQMLKDAYGLLKTYAINLINKPYARINSENIHTLNSILPRDNNLNELVYEFKRDDRDLGEKTQNALLTAFPKIFAKTGSKLERMYKKYAEKLVEILIHPNVPKKFTIKFLDDHGEIAIIAKKLSDQLSRTSLHFIINYALSDNSFNALIKLLKSKNCPNDLCIDIRSPITINQYNKILVASSNNAAVNGLRFNFHADNNEVALAILGYAEESILDNNRIHFHIALYSSNLSEDVIKRIHNLQIKINALGCVTLRQGVRNKSDIYFLSNEILENIFGFTLPSSKTLEQRNDYIQKIWHSRTGSRVDPEVSELIKKYNLADSSQVSLEKGLRKAANNNQVEDLELFIKHVVNINAQDANSNSRKTALHWAVEKGHNQCVALLLKAGANPKILDAKGKAGKNEELVFLPDIVSPRRKR